MTIKNIFVLYSRVLVFLFVYAIPLFSPQLHRSNAALIRWNTYASSLKYPPQDQKGEVRTKLAATAGPRRRRYRVGPSATGTGDTSAMCPQLCHASKFRVAAHRRLRDHLVRRAHNLCVCVKTSKIEKKQELFDSNTIHSGKQNKTNQK